MKGGAAAVGVGLAFLGADAALIDFGVHSAMTAAQFDQDMTLIHTQANASSATVEGLRQKILDLAPAVGIGPDELAKSMYHIQSVVPNAANAMDILKTAAIGAQIGQANLEDVTNALVSVMITQIKGAQDAGTAMGQLNAIVGAGNIRMQDLAVSMRSGVIATAKEFGLSLSDVGGALAMMADQGVPAQMAANRLRMTITLLGAPTGQSAKMLKTLGMTEAEIVPASEAMTEALKKAGLSHSQLATDMQKGGLVLAMQDLKKHMDAAGLSAETQADLIGRAFGGGRSGGPIFQMISNLDQLKIKTDAVAAGAGNLNTAWDYTQEHNPTIAMDRLRASWEAMQIELGEALLPVLIQFVNWLTPLIAKVNDWITVNHALITKWAPVVAIGLAVVGAILILVGILAMAAGAVVAIAAAGEILGVSLGAVAIGAAIVAAILAIAAGVVWLVHNRWTQLMALRSAIGAFFSAVGTWVHNAITTIQRLPGEAVRAVQKWWSDTVSSISTGTNNAKNTVTDFVTSVRDTIVRWIDGVLDYLETGWSRFAARPGYWLGFVAGFFVSWSRHQFEHFEKWGSDMVTLIGKKLEQWYNQFTNWLSKVPGEAESWLHTTLDRIIHFGEEIGIQAEHAGSRFLNNLVNWLWMAPGRAWDAVVGIGEAIGTLIGNMADAGWRAGSNFVTNLGNWLWNLPNEAARVGYDIVTGVISGIESLAGWAWSRAWNFARDLVSGMKKGIESGSPSEASAREVGVPLAQGVAMGFSRAAPDMTAAMQGVLPTGVLTGQIGISGMTASAVGSGYIPAGASPSFGGGGGGDDSAVVKLLQRIASGIEDIGSDATSRESPKSDAGKAPSQSALTSFAYALAQAAEQDARRGIRSNSF